MKFAAAPPALAILTGLLSCSHHIHGALLPAWNPTGTDSPLSLQGNNSLSGSSVLSTINNLQWYHDVVIRPRAQTMPVQAIVNILIQKLPHLAVLPPGDAPPWFRSSLTTVDKGDRKGYQVTLDVRSTNSPAPFQLTNSRLLHALSHLGLFDQQGEQAWYEFDFDIRMSKVTAWPAFTDTTIIATGNITNMGLTSTS